MRTLPEINRVIRDESQALEDRIEYIRDLSEGELVTMYYEMCTAFWHADVSSGDVEFSEGTNDVTAFMRVMSDSSLTIEDRQMYVDVLSIEDMKDMLIQVAENN